MRGRFSPLPPTDSRSASVSRITSVPDISGEDLRRPPIEDVEVGDDFLIPPQCTTDQEGLVVHIAEINLNCERFRTSAPGSSWRSWADKSGVWLDQVNSGPYAARGDWWLKGSKN
jgi:hypothetical protein